MKVKESVFFGIAYAITKGERVEPQRGSKGARRGEGFRIE